jgi:hypothetical protein
MVKFFRCIFRPHLFSTEKLSEQNNYLPLLIPFNRKWVSEITTTFYEKECMRCGKKHRYMTMKSELIENPNLIKQWEHSIA